jgi:hypothetical protein
MSRSQPTKRKRTYVSMFKSIDAHDLATPDFANRKNGMVEKEEENETRHILR